MGNYLSPLGAVTAVLRNATVNVPGITWGTSASPFYKVAPEPPPTFPYCIFGKIEAAGEIEQVMGLVDLEEEYRIPFMVYGTQDSIEQVSSPYSAQGLFHYLDALSINPDLFSGTLFTCVGWMRTSQYDIDLEEIRSTDGYSRVYVARAEYQMAINKAG